MWQPEYGKLSYSKVLDVKSPARANPGDAGIDFYVPEYNQDFFDQLTEKNKNNKVVIEINDFAQESNIIVGAQSSVLIPSGIKLNVPEGWALVAFAKSGVAVKKNLIPGACVVDHGYQGQLHISLINTSNLLQKISFGEKIIQFLMLPIGGHLPLEVNEGDLFDISSSRGEGGFGSTGVK